MTDQFFPDLSHARALVVEDVAFSRTLTRSLLVSAGVGTVEVAADAEEGRLRTLALRPDLIVLDWEFPGESGLEFARWIRQASDQKTRIAPILMVTAYREENRVLDAAACGINTYLAKPFSPREFLSKVKFCIEDSRPLRNRSPARTGISPLEYSLAD